MSLSDAMANQAPLASPIQAITGTTVWARIVDAGPPACAAFAPVTLTVLPCPTGLAQSLTFCEDVIEIGTTTIDGMPSIGASGTLTTHTWTGDISILSAANIQAPTIVATTAPGIYTLMYTVTEQSAYTCAVAGTIDCMSEPVTITVIINAEPAATLTPSTTICNGDCVDVVFTATAGAVGFSVIIDNGIGTVTNVQNNQIVANVCPTTTTIYNVTNITDANACICDGSTSPCASTTITVVDPPTANNVTLKVCPDTPGATTGTFILAQQ